VKKYIKRLL